MLYSRALGIRSPGTHNLCLIEDADHSFTRPGVQSPSHPPLQTRWLTVLPEPRNGRRDDPQVVRLGSKGRMQDRSLGNRSKAQVVKVVFVCGRINGYVETKNRDLFHRYRTVRVGMGKGNETTYPSLINAKDKYRETRQREKKGRTKYESYSTGNRRGIR